MNMFHRVNYCILVISGGFILYWILSQMLNLYPDSADTIPFFLQDMDFADTWAFILIILMLLLLTELGSIAYCMYKSWKLPRIIKDGKDGRYYKIQGRKDRPSSQKSASKPEALAYDNMTIIRKKLNFPDNLETDLFIEEADSLNAYTLGMEVPAGGKHAICLNSKLVAVLSSTNVAAVVAHEMGHVNNQDTAMKLFMGCFRSFVSFILFAPIYLLHAVIAVLSWLFSVIPVLGMFARLCLLISGLFIGLVRFLEILVMWPAHLYERFVSRLSEYQADAVSAKCVGPLSICRVLYMFSKSSQGRKNNPIFDFMEKLKISTSTHPSFEDRIHAVQKRLYQERTAMEIKHER